MSTDNSITQRFGSNLAELLAQKIKDVYPSFNAQQYIETIAKKCTDLSYTQRIILHTETLHQLLPADYPQAITILMHILGPENPNETGMFKEFYRLMPVGKYIELYDLDHLEISLQAIAEVTKRNTGEYAIRPYLKQYPEQTIAVMQGRTKSDNFHLRRLASEGCRPKLPRATKLDIFIKNPAPVFQILDQLIQDPIKFVQKSVANNIADYLKVNKPIAIDYINRYTHSDNKITQRILKHAQRNMK